jgi:hypothetical protein
MTAAGMTQWRPGLRLGTAAKAFAAGLPCLIAGIASAGDWSLETKVSERLDYYDNYRLLEESDGFIIGTTSTLGANAIYKGDDYRFDLLGNLSYRHHFGPGSEEDPDRFSPRIQTKFSKKGKSSAFDFSASFAREEVSTIDVLERLNVTTDTYRDTFGANAAWSKALDLRTSVGLSASIQRIIYEDDVSSLTPSTSADIGAFWSKRLTKRTDFKTSASVSFLSLENDEKTDREIVRLRADLSTQLTSTLKFRIGGGPRVVFSQRDDLLSVKGDRLESTDLGWNGDVGLDYAYKLGTISASISSATEPSTAGDLQNRITFGIQATRKLNNVSQAALSVQYRIAELDSSETQNVLSISPTLTYQLTDEWNLQAGYRFTFVDDSDGDAYGNNVFLTLSRAWMPAP